MKTAISFSVLTFVGSVCLSVVGSRTDDHPIFGRQLSSRSSSGDDGVSQYSTEGGLVAAVQVI